jgi:putative zinc finger/helix-turn-helix YgiT family protein
MKGAFCPNCEEYTEATLGVEREVYNVRGEPIEIEAEILICQRCGAKIFDEERDSRNLEKAYGQYRDKHNLLPPGQIRTIREKYGLSQRALSRLLGWGEITIHRYENGAIQDNVHDSTLRLIGDPQNMQKFFKANRSKLPAHIATRLERKIADFLQEDKEQAFQISFERLVSHQHIDLTSGFREYDLEKYKNMILYLVKRLNSVLKVKLNKLLWYCDFLHFKETSVSITGTQYFRLPLGPVPNNYDLITDIMQRERLLDKNEPLFQTKDGIVPGDEFVALVEPDKSLFSELEIKLMDFVADTFRNDTSTSIMNKSHEEVACQKTKDRHIISYEYAKELSLSLPE